MIKSSTPRFALQLWPLHDQMRHDAARTLAWVAEHCGANIEIAGFGNLTLSGWKNQISRFELNVVGIHGPQLDPDTDVEEFSEWASDCCHQLNTDVVVATTDPTTSPYDEGYYRHLAAKIDAIMLRLTASCIPNIKLSYHCYRHDLLAPSGRTTMDPAYRVLLKHVKNPLFGFQMDTYFIKAARSSFSEIASIAQRRVHSLHITDLDENDQPVPLGSGVLSLPDILKMFKRENPFITWILEPAIPTADSAKEKILRDTIVQSVEFWRKNSESLFDPPHPAI